MTLNLQILRDTATPAVQRLLDAGRGAGLRRAAGRGVANRLREHFQELNRTRPNQLGGRRTRFYADVARSVQQPQVQADTAVVSITHVGIAQRYFGGRIRPVEARYITVPLVKEAYGRRAREFPDLFPIKRGRTLLLVRARQTRVRFVRGRKGKPGRFRALDSIGSEPNRLDALYVLKEEVNQDPDPTVLPPEAELQAAAVEAGREWIATQEARAAEGGVR